MGNDLPEGKTLTKTELTESFKVAFFCSRNKDNKEIDSPTVGRTKVFLTKESPEQLKESFETFVKQGAPGEMSRFYLSVNKRDVSKVRKALLHYLIDHEEMDLTTIKPRIASIASLKENAAEKKWLFDFDDEPSKIDAFLKDVRAELPKEVGIYHHKTPNGYAVIVDRGFDTRSLLSKWTDVSLKRDDMLCVMWARHTN